jgi:hypothetical protein
VIILRFAPDVRDRGVVSLYNKKSLLTKAGYNIVLAKIMAFARIR